MMRPDETSGPSRRPKRHLRTVARLAVFLSVLTFTAASGGTAAAGHGDEPACPGTLEFQQHNQATQHASGEGLNQSGDAIRRAASHLQPRVPHCTDPE